jgi:hypothetical protein
MKIYLVAISTCVALFWDEVLISIATFALGKKIDHRYMITWMICSGILTSILVSYNVPPKYRLITLALITAAMYFSLMGYYDKEKFQNDNEKETLKTNS